MRRLLLMMLLVVAGSSAASAQGITGAITGVVKDQSGAVVPGATVTVRNVATNIETSPGSSRRCTGSRCSTRSTTRSTRR